MGNQIRFADRLKADTIAIPHAKTAAMKQPRQPVYVRAGYFFCLGGE
ncbi:hypothetical protein [Brevibacillus choshinensis]|nr:hypothetical protein [Brevibacillus choshinensis]